MSLQIFLQGKILGTDAFLLSGSHVAGRIWWTSLLSEVLPRALLAELGLSSMLLGSSGGHQFIVVLPDEAKAQADEFCRRAAAAIEERSSARVRFVWAATENLGDWSDIRKRLDEQMNERTGAPLTLGGGVFEPFLVDAEEAYFRDLADRMREAESAGWVPEAPGDVQAGQGKYTWRLEEMPFARHQAPVESLAELGGHAEGRKAWGVLRGDVDSFGLRLRRAQNVEEHLQVSLMYKQFFAAELQMRCSLPEFWQRVTLLWAGGDDFAICGAWDALIAIAREIQRIFHVFVETNLKEYAGLEGKTITMALALAEPGTNDLGRVLADATQKLDIAKSSGKDSIYLLGRTLEWKQLADAAATREIMARMIKEFGASPQFLQELGSFYAEADSSGGTLLGGRGRNDRVERPWRFHRRLNRVIGGSRDREFQRLRSELIADFTGRRAKQIRLRPQGRVALEWARLETEEPAARSL